MNKQKRIERLVRRIEWLESQLTNPNRQDLEIHILRSERDHWVNLIPRIEQQVEY